MKHTILLVLKGGLGGLTVFAIMLAVLCQSCSSQEKMVVAKNGTMRTRGNSANVALAKQYNSIQYRTGTVANR